MHSMLLADHDVRQRVVQRKRVTSVLRAFVFHRTVQKAVNILVDFSLSFGFSVVISSLNKVWGRESRTS
jgi:hypothetical protein